MIPYILFDHQAKSRAFTEALAPKYSPIPRISKEYRTARFVLTDNHVLSRRTKLEQYYKDGLRKFFIYPHAGRPGLATAFYPPWSKVTAEFVATEAHAEVMRQIGNKNKLHAVGWSLCPIVPFRPRLQVRKVLFAPIHPRNSDIDRRVNRAVFYKLFRLARAGEILLTVRYLAPLDGNGLVRVDHPNIKYVEGAAGPDWKQIDESDMVIAHQTFLFLAVARGVPALAMWDGVTPHVEYRGGEFLEMKGWEDVKDQVMYPLDILHADNPTALMMQAAADDRSIAEWRARMIGPAFDPGRFLELVEGYL